MKWFFRRKANRALDELNTRLKLGIQPFKTTKRRALIDQLLFDVDVVRAIEEHASENNIPREVALMKAERYAHEIVPAFNAYAYSKIGTQLARFVSTFVYRVRLGYSNDEALAKVDPESTVVFVMNHRSNMDYMLVTYLASASASLSYAVGEWARVWILQTIVRWMGAYFIRRDSGNQLYRRVLARYVHMATRSGVTQAMFPEGGLSRDGELLLGNPGAVALVLGADVPIVPCAILGAHEALGPGRGLRLRKGTIRFGQPIPAAELAPANVHRKQRLALATRRIMTEIAALAGTRSREDVLEDLRSAASGSRTGGGR